MRLQTGVLALAPRTCVMRLEQAAQCPGIQVPSMPPMPGPPCKLAHTSQPWTLHIKDGLGELQPARITA